MSEALALMPSDLKPGDVVVTDDEVVRVMGEPLTMHRGTGPFDEFEYLIGVWAQEPGGPRRIRKWPPGTVLDVIRGG